MNSYKKPSLTQNEKKHFAMQITAWLISFFVFISYFFVGSLLFSSPTNAAQPDSTAPNYDLIFEELNKSEDISYMLYDTEKGQVLLNKDNTERTNASLLAKMMTCYIVIENSDFTDKIIADQTTVSLDEKHVLTKGVSYSIDTLVGTALMDNADNVLRFLAEKVPIKNTESESFVAYMNEKALEFGMNNTFFTNADGSESDLQKTTVYDTVLFLKNALRNSRFKKIYCSPVTVSWDGVIIENQNNIVIENTTSTLGGSLGYFNNTEQQATTTYYFESATSNILDYKSIILVVSGVAAENYADAQKALLDRFNNTWNKTLYHKKGEVFGIMAIGSESLYLETDRDIYFYVPEGESNYIENMSYSYAEGYSPDVITAPISSGTEICTVQYRLKDNSTFQVVLHAQNTIVSEKSTVNHMAELMNKYPELFISIFVLFGIAMFCSVKKISTHFLTK